MTDAEYIFYQTSKDRKRNGRGDYNKKRQGGKTIRFPSDSLSRKEKNALNGEVTTYSFIKPLTWEEFRKMPTDIQQKYFDTIKEKFDGIPFVLLSESLGMKNGTVTSYMSTKGLKFGDGKRTRASKFLETEEGKAWVKWHEDYRPSKKEEAVVEVSDNDVNVPSEDVEQKEKALTDADKIAQLIASLAGTGAKITIEITV